jgi:uncharacterized membrane protein
MAGNCARKYLPVAVVLRFLASGCTIGERHTIKLDSRVIPDKVSLSSKESIKLQATATNIGTSTEIITADVGDTEGIEVVKSNSTRSFTLKPGESRVIEFDAKLTHNAVPGDYILDVQIKTNSGDLITDRVKLRVVEKKGFL